MKKLVALALIPVLAGCLSSGVPIASYWNMEYLPGQSRSAQDGKSEVTATKCDIARVSQVIVRSPYNENGIVVLRGDGSVAFDSYNEFAAQPSTLMKGVVFEAMGASGLFKTVVNPSSAAMSSASVEVMVTRLALDCRKEGVRTAVAEVLIRLLAGAEVLVAKGSGSADAADGNYGAAFSRAASAALDSAFDQLR